MESMRLRTLALALALSCGAATMVQAAGQKPRVYKAKRFKTKKYKQSKAAKVKPRKAPKHTHTA
jgi:hypothetical protein